jgi:hypothetical protein
MHVEHLLTRRLAVGQQQSHTVGSHARAAHRTRELLGETEHGVADRRRQFRDPSGVQQRHNQQMPGRDRRMSMNAMQWASRCTMLPGARPAMIAQKMHSTIVSSTAQPCGTRNRTSSQGGWSVSERPCLQRLSPALHIRRPQNGATSRSRSGRPHRAEFLRTIPRGRQQMTVLSSSQVMLTSSTGRRPGFTATIRSMIEAYRRLIVVILMPSSRLSSSSVRPRHAARTICRSPGRRHNTGSRSERMMPGIEPNTHVALFTGSSMPTRVEGTSGGIGGCLIVGRGLRPRAAPLVL